MTAVATALKTAEEFYEWVQRPENRDRHFQLVEGEIVEMPPPGKFHGFVCGNASRILGNFCVQRKRGYVCTNDSGVIVERDPDTVRGPDVSFFDDDETADDMERKYAVDPPRLAVAVMSPSDRINSVVRTVMQLLNRGVMAVWVIDPEARDVIVYRKDREPEFFSEEQDLTCEDVLPGFRCRVAEFFQAPSAA